MVPALVAGILAAGASAGSAPLIRGGEEARQGQLPGLAFVAYLLPGNDRAIVCTGTVIAPRLVLTAAHCVKPRRTHTDPENFRVVTGNVDWVSSERQVLGVERTLIHPNYLPNRRADAALLELSAPTTAPRVALAAEGFWEPGTKAEIAGWGNLRPGPARLIGVLHRGPTVVRDEERCAEGLWRPEMICVNDRPRFKVTTCIGDSGGPLLAHRPGDRKLVQIGVLYGGSYCKPKNFSYYTPTPTITHWVRARMAEVAARP